LENQITGVKTMRLNIRAMTFALSILWAAAVLVTGLANIFWPNYGTGFLKLLASVYPGYKASGSIGDLINGILYAFVDGGLFGLVFAWLYNRFLGRSKAVAGNVKERAGECYSPVEPHS
jgi:hypothetical protein